MRKLLMISGLTVGFLALTVALVFGLLDFANKPVETKTAEAEEVSDVETAEADDIDAPEVILKETANEDLEELFPDSMSESTMQTTIHHMAHGLVQAEQKWGKIEITQDRLERLLQVAEQQEGSYKEGSLYVSILSNWTNGDFSNAVADHNSIWKLQDGTIGKANRLLTAEEITEYNETNFE